MSLRVEIPWVLVEIWEKIVFCVERGAEEAKCSFWKTVIVWPLKTENPLISQVKYSWMTREMPQMHRASFTKSYILRKSRERVVKLYV